MKKLYTLGCIVLFAAAGFALEVDQNEIKTSSDQTIEFINYTGSHDAIDSIEAIRGIGSSLATAVNTGKSGSANRYQIIHAVDSDSETGFDADILIIGKDARVDHINNIRAIITAYLMDAYGYSQKDARTIAFFSTVYNAVYRKDMQMFTSRYKGVVTQHLTADKAGLATVYSEWPGKTQIVIPLSDSSVGSKLSIIDTTVISEPAVIEKVREDADKGTEPRKDLIDLKERESSESKKIAEKKKKEAEAAKQKAETAKKEAAAAKKEAATAKKEAAAAKKEAAKNPNDKAAQKKAQEKEAAAEKKEASAKEKQTDADKKKETAKEKEQDAQKEEQFAEKKEKEADADRKEVARDTQKIIEDKKAEKKAAENERLSSAIPGYGLKVLDENDMLSNVVLFDTKTTTELKKSPIDTIRGRVLYKTEKGLMAIAGTSTGEGVISLVLIDPKTLEIIKQGNENIASQSVLISNNGNYYAVVNQNGTYYLGRFDETLALQAKSSAQVLPYTAITFADDNLIIQNISGQLILLGANDLIEKK